jgi:hypothetical protein
LIEALHDSHMPSPDAKEGPTGLPDGQVAVPVGADQKSALLRVCVVLQKTRDGRPALVVLRDTVDARVYLGCVTDFAGGVVRSVELWVQNPATLATSMSLRRAQVTNTHADRRWQRVIKALERLAPSELIRTGWELAPQPATYIDPASLQPVHPAAPASGQAPVLCRDDAQLAAAGLPAYSASQHRYLQVATAAAPQFVPLTPDAPAGASVRPLAEVLPRVAELLPFNPAAGHVLVRSHAAASYGAYVDTLTDLRDAASKAQPGGAAAAGDAVAPLDGDGWLFIGQHGQVGRLVEALHLKLRAVADTVESVAAAVRQLQLPLLDVSADSFRVEVGPPARGLPSLWTARVRLVDPGDTVEWALPGAEARYYLPARSGAGSIYMPPFGQPVQGRGAVRIRQVLPAGAGSTAVVLEGTLVTQERIDAAGRDLMWFRMNVAGTPLDVYARLEKATALAAGEWRFRSVPLSPPPAVLAALKAEEGFQGGDVPFEHLPLLSTPCDLYSLGVVAARTLLVNARTSLPVALDEVMSLARQVAADPARNAPLPARVARVLSQDKRWVESLGPQRLTNEPLAAQQAFDVVPADVWCEVLGLIIKMFPGVGPDSYARDLGDAPPEGLHAVFTRPLEDLNALLLRTRSLIVIDWKYNREVHTAIRSTLLKWAPELTAARER